MDIDPAYCNISIMPAGGKVNEIILPLAFGTSIQMLALVLFIIRYSGICTPDTRKPSTIVDGFHLIQRRL